MHENSPRRQHVTHEFWHTVMCHLHLCLPVAHCDGWCACSLMILAGSPSLLYHQNIIGKILSIIKHIPPKYVSAYPEALDTFHSLIIPHRLQLNPRGEVVLTVNGRRCAAVLTVVPEAGATFCVFSTPMSGQKRLFCLQKGLFLGENTSHFKQQPLQSPLKQRQYMGHRH